MKTRDLAYPVLEIDKSNYLGVAVDEDTLTTATSHELKKGFKKSMTLVDSYGRTVKVKDAKFVSGKGSFWGYCDLFLGRVIKIDLELDDTISQIPFDKLKKMITGNMKRWGSAIDPDYIEEELAKISKTENTGELIKLFTPFNDRKEFYKMLKKH